MNPRPSSRLNLFGLAGQAILLAACFWACPLQAQIAGKPVPPPVQFGPKVLSKEKLGQLLAPIALYPDALIALILPASTVPSDVVLGARYLQSNGDPAHTENQPWDESVKSLTHYPEVLAWMDKNLEWTASVGEAFVEQPADVMSAIQALREQAKTAGNLVDTPQQKVIDEGGVIRIVPADPEVIYVPQYDPQVVYIQSFTSVPFVTFGLGCAVGAWLSYDFDWNRRCFYRGNWRGWNQNNIPNRGPGGNHGGTNLVNIDLNNANPWQPSASARRQTSQRQLNNNGNARYLGAGSGVVNAVRPSVPGSVNNRASQPAIGTPASNPLPQPSNIQPISGNTGQNPRPPGISTSLPLSDPVAPTVIPGLTPNTARPVVPTANPPRLYTPQISQPEPQPSHETPESRYPPPQVQQRLLQVPQQRPTPFVNPQIQPQPAPVMSPSNRQQPATDTGRGYNGR